MAGANPFGPPPEIYGYQTLWHSIGNYMARLELYERSLPFFNEAIRLCPDDKKTLIDRGKVRGKTCFFTGALEDINKAINLDPDDLVSLAERSDAIYLNCEFEDAIVQNYRLLPLRTKPDHFAMGVRKCSTAIKNCLSKVAGSPLRDHFLIIRKLAWLESYKIGNKVDFVASKRKVKKIKKKIKSKVTRKMEPISISSEASGLQIRDSVYSHESAKFVVPPLQKTFNFSPLQRYTTNIENYMAETYLERMYLEKIFLKQAHKIPGINSPNQTGMHKLKSLAKKCFITVNDKQEVLRTRRPFYNVKYQQAKISGTLKDRQEAELMLIQEQTKKEADKIVWRLQNALDERNLTTVIELVEKLKSFCDSKSKRLLPEKQLFLSKIYRIICDAFYMVNRINPDQPKWDQEKRILVALGQPISKEPSQDSVIGLYQVPIVDFKQQIQLFEGRLDIAEDDQEILWYYHELARYSMMAKNYEQARSFCTRCVILAEKNNEFQWCINALVLSMRICIRQTNKNDASLEANRAMNVAKRIGDQNVIEYLTKCLAVINEIEFEDPTGRKILERRQAKILAMMQNDKVKSEFSHLFHTMSVQPSNRRLSIIPGAITKKNKSLDKDPMKAKSTKSIVGVTDSENFSKATIKGANFVSYL